MSSFSSFGATAALGGAASVPHTVRSPAGGEEDASRLDKVARTRRLSDWTGRIKPSVRRG